MLLVDPTLHCCHESDMLGRTAGDYLARLRLAFAMPGVGNLAEASLDWTAEQWLVVGSTGGMLRRP